MGILRFYSRHGAHQLDVVVAATVATRLRGLLTSPPLRPNQGLLLCPCNMVHTVGMRYPLDLVFLRHDGVVLHVALSVPPNRLRLCWRARYTLELAAGTAARCAIARGVTLPVGTLK